MNTLDSVLLIVVSSILSLFFLVTSLFIIYMWVTFRRITKKAEMAINNVENISHVINDISASKSTYSVIKLFKLIFKLSRKD